LIGDVVRRRREELGISGGQLAARAGMAPSAVSQIETGKRIPSSASVVKLAAALGVEISELYPKKAQAPLPLEDFRRGGAEDLSKAALGALDSWVRVIGGLIEDFELILRELPEKPTGEEYGQAHGLLVPLLRQADRINDALLRTELVEASNELWAAAKAGEPVTRDLARMDRIIREFHSLVERLNAEIVPAAGDWVQRLSEIEKLHKPGLFDEHLKRWRQEAKEAAERQAKRGHKNATQAREQPEAG
jgi:transcriptional regulator with XRE-family HTH domain